MRNSKNQQIIPNLFRKYLWLSLAVYYFISIFVNKTKGTVKNLKKSLTNHRKVQTPTSTILIKNYHDGKFVGNTFNLFVFMTNRTKNLTKRKYK